MRVTNKELGDPQGYRKIAYTNPLHPYPFRLSKSRCLRYEDALDIIRKLKLPKEQAVQLFRIMVFNVMARNQDDHTKNISFIMDKSGKWSLTPAYDVTYAYKPTGQSTNGHQMTIAGKRYNFTGKDLQSIANDISYTNAKDGIEAIQVTLNQWEHYADRAGIPNKQSQKLKKAFRLNLKV